MTRWLKIAGLGLAGLVVLLVLLVTALLGTTTGARVVLTRVIPAEVRVGSIDGRLWGPLVLEDVRYEAPGVQARVARVAVDWRPTRLLLRRTLELTALDVDSADVRLRETDAGEPEPEPEGGPMVWDRPSAPVTIRLERLRGRALRVVTAAGDTVRVDRVVLAGGARRDTFDLDSLRVRDFDYRGHRFRVDAGGRIVTGATGARDSAGLDLEWSGTLADGRPVAGRGTVRGAGGDLVVDHRLTAPVAAGLEGEVRVPWTPDTLTWSAVLDVPRFTLDRLREGLPGELALDIRAAGGLASARATVAARGAHPVTGPAAADLRVAYGDGAVTVDTVRLRRLEGPGEVWGRARLALSDTGPSADARLAWRALGWPLDTSAIASPDGTLRLEGWIDGFRATAGLALRRADASLGRWTVRTDGRYRDGRLVVPQLVASRAGGGRLTLTADVALAGGPGGRATLRWTDLAWPPGPGDSVRVASADGRVEVRGAAEDFSVVVEAALSGAGIPLDRLTLDARGSAGDEAVRARVSATGLVAGSPALELDGRGSYGFAGRRVVLDTLDARLPETGGRLGLRGDADLSGDTPRVTARVRWRDLGWPLSGPRYRSAEGELTVETREDGALRIGADARLGGGTLPEGRWRLAGQGDLGRFAVDSLRGAVLGGAVRAAGVVWPDSGPAWDLDVAGDSLDPGQWREGWDGRLAFRLASDGRVAEAGPTFRLTLDRLEGGLRGRPVAGRAEVRGEAGGIAVDTLWLESGESTVAAAGTVGDSLDVTWRLAAASLYDFIPGGVGELDAEGRLTGPRDAPSVALTARGRGLTVEGWSAEGLRATADVAAAGRDSSSAELALTGVRGASLALDSVVLSASGTRSAHAATLLAGSPDDVLEGRLAGGIADGRWAGVLSRFRLRSALAGDWRLRDTARLAVGPDSGEVDGFCWDGDGELCLEAAWGPGGVRWSGSGQGLPVAFLRPALPQEITARGRLALETEGRTGAGPVPTGTLRLTGGAGEIDYAPDLGRTVTQPYDTLAVMAESDSAGLRGRAELRLGALGSIEADAALMGAGPVPERTLDGRVRVQLTDSGAVSRYVPAITGSRGRLDADVRMAGTVAAPRVAGRVALTDAAAMVTPAGLRLSDGRLEARSDDGRRWTLEGGVASDSSRLEVAGSARLPGRDSAWLVDLRLEADSFPAVRTPDLTVVASPRLALRASPDSVTVDGRIAVPSARIAVQELEGTVAASPDVVVVGADGAAPDSAVTPATVRGTVELVLGDSVRIDALGLTGRLDGQLVIAAQPGRPPVGNGELELEDAEYRIYRQTFQIDEGRLLFASTPLSNPGLELRVTRSSQDVTVGMEITGRASDPRVRLFSDPSLSDEEILAYLIVGRPLRRLSQSEGSQVQSMARSVGVAGGNLLLARLGAAFGLETARIERTNPDDEGARQTRLILGRQVLPRVHVDYAIGLGEAANILRLRYMITDHWIFQTESGEETGADLLYTWGQ